MPLLYLLLRPTLTVHSSHPLLSTHPTFESQEFLVPPVVWYLPNPSRVNTLYLGRIRTQHWSYLFLLSKLSPAHNIIHHRTWSQQQTFTIPQADCLALALPLDFLCPSDLMLLARCLFVSICDIMARNKRQSNSRSRFLESLNCLLFHTLIAVNHFPTQSWTCTAIITVSITSITAITVPGSLWFLLGIQCCWRPWRTNIQEDRETHLVEWAELGWLLQRRGQPWMQWWPDAICFRLRTV